MTKLENQNHTGRFIPYGVFDGATNMALDEVLLELARSSAEENQITLRFYGWQPDAVSIGYGQRLAPSRLDEIEQAGFDVVKRPTGGRAVLHNGELTYSFVGHESLLGKNIATAYARICSGLIAGFKDLGLTVVLGDSRSKRGSYRDKEDCFLAITTADLKLDEKKLVGSAQLRRGDWVLQHGSILLEQPQELMPGLLGSKPVSGIETDQTRHANLFEYIPTPIAVAELSSIFKHGFEQAFDLTLLESDFSEVELRKASELKEKFSLRRLARS